MAKIERLESGADMSDFDGRAGEDEAAEEGSRLPLLILIALLVLAAFAGVVWLAYTQGVERGRADAPRIMEAQGTSGAKLKVYQQPAPAAEGTEADSVPPAPSPLAKDTPQATPDLRPSAISTPEVAPLPQPPAKSRLPVQVSNDGAQEAVGVSPAPAQSPMATGAPARLAPTLTEAANVPAAKTALGESLPASVPSGSYLLQIGAYKSLDEADAARLAFEGKHPVASLQFDIKRVDLGDKGTWYRLRLGSFADKTAADAMCARLKAAGSDCLMAK